MHKCIIMYCIYKILLYSHVYLNIDINLSNVQFRHWNLLKVLHWKTVPKQKVEEFKFFKILWSAFKIITAVSTGSARPHAYSTPERYRTLYGRGLGGPILRTVIILNALDKNLKNLNFSTFCLEPVWIHLEHLWTSICNSFVRIYILYSMWPWVYRRQDKCDSTILEEDCRK